MSSILRIAAVARKEWIDYIVRNPAMRKAMVVQPLLVFVVFGFAVKSEMKNAAWILYDADRTTLSRRFAGEIVASGQVASPRCVSSYAAVHEGFQRGDGSAALVIPTGFTRDVEGGRRSAVQLLLNGADPLVALRLGSLVSDVAGRFLEREGAEKAELAPRRVESPAIMLRRTVLYNPHLRDEWFFIPAGAAVFLTQLFLGALCWSIVGERERGTWEHLLALPLAPYEILVGKTLPFFGIGYGLLLIHEVLAFLAFGIRIRGGVLDLAVASLLFFTASTALAMLLSTLARNVQQAVYLSVLVSLPSIVISGFLVPNSIMPRPIQLAAQALPATHYVTMLRAIIVRGASLRELGAPLLALGIIAALAFVLVLAFFPRRVTA